MIFLRTDKSGMEEGFSAPEPFVTDRDDLTIRKLIRFLKYGRCGSHFNFVLKVQRHITQFFFHISNDFPFCRRVEIVTWNVNILRSLIYGTGIIGGGGWGVK